MTTAVFKAIFRHRRWQTDRVVHFIPVTGAQLLSAARDALNASLLDPAHLNDYELLTLYYLGTPEEAYREPEPK